MKKIFVSGGAGYIGSHTVKELLDGSYEVTVFDNLSNSNLDNLHKIEEVTGKKIHFIEGDLTNKEDLEKALTNEYSAVIHFAALKSVIESQSNPLKYYENNVSGTINLLQAMLKAGVFNIVFSSTGAVYGQPDNLPIKEIDAVKPMNVYAASKVMVEQILKDSEVLGINSVSFRYFNVAGAEKGGLIGEAPEALGNLIPRVFANLIGKHDLVVYGNQFNTVDGTQVRDYIHVVDLAKAHVKALSFLEKNKGNSIINLGTGKGNTVLEVIHEVENVTNRKVNFSFGEARIGESVEIYADCQKAKELLNWVSDKSLHEIIEDSWNWYKNLDDFKSLQ